MRSIPIVFICGNYAYCKISKLTYTDFQVIIVYIENNLISIVLGVDIQLKN